MNFNCTYFLLAPILSHYGEDFVQDLIKLQPFFYGVGYKRLKHYKIVVATKIIDYDFAKKYKRHVVAIEETVSKKHGNVGIITVKIPEVYHEAWRMFMQGKYSKMYTDEQISQLYTTDDRFCLVQTNLHNVAKAIFTRNNLLRKKLEDKIGVELSQEAEVYSKFRSNINIVK